MKTEERERQAYKLAKANKHLFLPKPAKSERSAAPSMNAFNASLNTEDWEESKDQKRRLTAQEIDQLRNLETLYWKSFETLEKVFKRDFTRSKTFKDMVLLLNQNMVEYKFMRQAGVLR